MAKTYTITVPDPEAGALSFYVGSDAKIHVNKSWVCSGGHEESPIDMELPAIVADGGITAGERAALVATLTKLNGYLRAKAGLV